MESKLRLAIKLFEEKFNNTEEEDKKRCNGNFDKEKMRRYVNRKLKKEIMILNYVNLFPSARAITLTKKFKY